MKKYAVTGLVINVREEDIQEKSEEYIRAAQYYGIPVDQFIPRDPTQWTANNLQTALHVHLAHIEDTSIGFTEKEV